MDLCSADPGSLWVRKVSDTQKDYYSKELFFTMAAFCIHFRLIFTTELPAMMSNIRILFN